MFIKRWIWGLVGDCVNGTIMFEEIMMEAKERGVSPLEILQARLSEQHK